MAQTPSTGINNDSFVRNYIKKNIYLKIFIFYFLLLGFILLGLFLLSGTKEGYQLATAFNKTIFYISGLFSLIPGYNFWVDNFAAYKYYLDYTYELNYKFLQSDKMYIYLIKFYIEMIPFVLASFLFLKRFINLRSFFKDYYSTLVYRNLKIIDNPIKKLEEGLKTEGVDNKDYNEEQLKYLEKFYNNKKTKEEEILGITEIYKNKLYLNIKNYYDSLLKLKLKLKTQQEWDNFFNELIDNQKQPYEYLKIFVFKNIDYMLLEKKDIERLKLAFSWNFHFKWNTKSKKWVSREFFIDSLEKEVDNEKLYNYYYTTFLFWINKQWTNFPMYIYTHNLDVPLEWKKLNKWVEGLNAPGKTEIIIGKKGNKLILKTVDLYYRLYMFRNYIGIDCDYMIDFIKMIDEEFGIK